MLVVRTRVTHFDRGVRCRCHLDEPDENFYDHGLATDTIAKLRYAGAKVCA